MRSIKHGSRRASRVPRRATAIFPLKIPAKRKIFLATLISGGLLWAILQHSIPAALSTYSPELALRIRPAYPDAVLAFENSERQKAIDNASIAKQNDIENKKLLSGDQSLNDRVEKIPLKPTQSYASGLAAALQAEPLNPEAFRQLAEISLIGDDLRKAERFMQISADLSAHEGRAHYWLMNRDLEAGRFRRSLQHAETLLLSQPNAMTFVSPALLQMSVKDSAREVLIDKLAENPGWRGQFFQSFSYSAFNNPQFPLVLFIRLREKQKFFDMADIRPYLDYLISKGLYNFAYTAWLQFLPEDQLRKISFLNDGSFEGFVESAPFGWSIGRGEYVSVSAARRPDDSSKHALLVNFANARVQFPPVRQFLVLPSGSYAFSVEATGNLNSRRGLIWRVSCLSGQELARSILLTGANRGWRRLSFRFEVPAEKCDAQVITLEFDARTPSEQFASGNMWFDNIVIERATNSSPVDQRTAPVSDNTSRKTN